MAMTAAVVAAMALGVHAANVSRSSDHSLLGMSWLSLSVQLPDLVE
jgi:hypothetical protein